METTAIHIEIDVLFLIMLFNIAWQIIHSVSQQMSRVIFRYVVFGNMTILVLDILWMLVEGKTFPGAITLNKIINAVYLGGVVVMGGVWYLYVLEILKHKITFKLALFVLSPGILFMILNLISIKTGWIFYIDENNHYQRGPWFILQTVIALLTLFGSMIHLALYYIFPRPGIPRHQVRRLMWFYVVPFVGTLAALPFAGMPGTWTCAAVSVILMYMDEQEIQIQRDSLTGLNNRKTLESAFSSFTRQVTGNKNLYLFICDLDKFKDINDTLGHSAGDMALVDTAHILEDSMKGIHGIIARYGGDEFLMMAFFEGDPDALAFKNSIRESFEQYNRNRKNPYPLSTSIGYSRWHEGQSFEELLKDADLNLYEDKEKRNSLQ